MNKERRKRIEELTEKLGEAKTEIEEILSEEEDALAKGLKKEDLPEHVKGGGTYYIPCKHWTKRER